MLSRRLSLACILCLCPLLLVAGEASTVGEERELSILRLRFAEHFRHLEKGETWDKTKRNPRKYTRAAFDVFLYCRDGLPTGGYRAEVIGPEGAEADDQTPGEGGAETQIPRALFPSAVWTGKLERDDDRLAGWLGVGFPWFAREYLVDARLVGEAVVGTFTHPDAQQAGERWELTGTVIRGAALEEWRAARALADGGAWPNWKGPTWDGRTGITDPPLVEHWKHARLAWVSEALLAGGGGGAGHPHPRSTRTDYNGPLVADGQVVFATVERSAASPDWPGFTAKRADLQGLEERPAPVRRWVRHASAIIVADVVYGMDAATGATRWRTVLEARGVSGNLTGKGKGGLWSTGVLRDGRFFFMGSSGWLYGLDAATGEVLWESRQANPERIATFEENLAKLKRGEIKLPLDDPKKAGRGSLDGLVSKTIGEVHQVQASLAIAAGALVCFTGPTDGDALVGIDPATGKRLWGPVSGCRWGAESPVPWSVGGREYILTGRACLEPRTGEVLWRIEAKAGKYSPAVRVGEDLLVLGAVVHRGERSRDTIRGLLAYRVAPGGAERLWGWQGRPERTDHGGKVERFNTGCVTLTADPARKRVVFKAQHGDFFAVDATDGRVLDHQWFGNKMWGGQTLAAGGTRLIDASTRMVHVAEDGRLDYRGSLYGLRFTCTTPVMADGRLFVRAPYGIVCYDLRKE